MLRGLRAIFALASATALTIGLLAIAPASAVTLDVTRLGYCGGDDWEPDIAVDGAHVYVAITHFTGSTACDANSAAAQGIYLQVSNDGGASFGSPEPVFLGPIDGVDYTRQADPTVAVDGSHNVYVAFLDYGVNGGHTDVVVAKSTDHGGTFAAADVRKINAHDCKNCDHEKILATGSTLYVAYSQAANHFVNLSTDAGSTWTQTKVLKADAVAFAEGGAIDGGGNAWFAWADCQSSNCTGVPAVDYRVSKTTPTGSTTFSSVLATAVQGPDCVYKVCGFAYWGAQNDVAIDGGGSLYMAWQQGSSSSTRGSPPIVNLSVAPSAGSSWQSAGGWTARGRVDDGGVPTAYALYPTVVGGIAGTVYVAWFDDRNGTPLDHKNGWNVWLRTSTTAGSTWTGGSARISEYDPTQAQSGPDGFLFPYGDYFGLAKKSCGAPALTWGEGQNYAGGPSAPGHIEYRSLC